MFFVGLMERHQLTSILSQQVPDHMDKVCHSLYRFMIHLSFSIEFDKKKNFHCRPFVEGEQMTVKIFLKLGPHNVAAALQTYSVSDRHIFKTEM